MMRKFCFIAAMAFSFFAVFPPAAQAAETAEWILEQKAQDLGEQTVYISPDAVKIVCHTMGFNVLAKAPKWQVYCYRPVSKELWIGTMEQFNGTVLINPFALPCKNVVALDQVGTLSYNNLKCTKYCNKRTKRPVILMANDIAASAKVCELLCRYYYANDSTKVPVYRLVYAGGKTEKPHSDWLDMNMTTDLRQGDRITLSTQSAKKVPFNAADFQLPSDCKRVKEINQVAFSSDKRDAMGDLIGELGFTPGSKEKSAQKAKRPTGPK